MTPVVLALAVLFLQYLHQGCTRDGDHWKPFEGKIVTISRATGTLTFPANFMLVGAMNPCPCGYLGDPVKECTCGPMMISRYRPAPLRFGDSLRSQAHLGSAPGPQRAASPWDRHPHRGAARRVRPRRGGANHRRWRDRRQADRRAPGRAQRQRPRTHRACAGDPAAAVWRGIGRRARRPAPAVQRRHICTCGADAGVGPAQVREYCKLDDAGKSLLKARHRLGGSALGHAAARHERPRVSPHCGASSWHARLQTWKARRGSRRIIWRRRSNTGHAGKVTLRSQKCVEDGVDAYTDCGTIAIEC